MKRAIATFAAFLMLLFAFSTPPTPASQTAAPQPSEQPAVLDDIPRHTPITRSERTALQRTLTVNPGDTYSRWAIAQCGNFAAWPGIQAVNGWPERAIPVGARAVIVCGVSAPPAAKPAAPAPKPAAAPKTIGAAWVHPLASGRNGNSCYRTSRRPGHNGVDIAQPSGTPIRAVAAGAIYRKAYQPGGAGYYVAVKHAGNVYTRYHHLRAHSPLNVGAAVSAGQIIGYVGATGNATGNHLHFEVHQGGYEHHTNPAAFMRAHGINIGC